MKKLFFLALGLIALNATAQSVSINTDGSTADNSAILDVKSTDKGVLIPRMTEAQRNLIATPATGLMIYQTDDTAGFYFYNGTTWTSLNGTNGASGANGQGVPTGGDAGQVLAKVDGTDYNTQWVTPSAGGGTTSYKGVVLDVFQSSPLTVGVGAPLVHYSGILCFNSADVVTAPPSNIGTFTSFDSTTSTQAGKTFAVKTNHTAPTNTPGAAFTVIEPGYYQVESHVVAATTSGLTSTPQIVPFINVCRADGSFKTVVFGTSAIAGNAVAADGIRSRASVTSVLKLEAGDYFGIFVNNLSSAVSGAISTNGTTRLTVVKL
ncbi:MAG: hypothetical protein MUF43_13350 [Flavobacterium sp.]|nr:hypothetical protein [Flavobacterium sp.]